MKFTSFRVSDWQAVEQLGGYWLVNLTLHSADLLDVGTLFWINSKPDEPLLIFHQTLQSGTCKLQLLSHTPLDKNTVPDQLQASIPERETLSIPTSKNLLLIGSGLPMANLFHLAKHRSSALLDKINDGAPKGATLALLHSSEGFPFTVKPARFMQSELPPEAIGACPLLEDWKIGNRLASDLGLPGCYEGGIDDMLLYWIEQHLTQVNLHNQPIEEWHIMACLPKTMQKKCLQLCQSFDWLSITGIDYAETCTDIA